jgi:hypothetical protein
MIIKGSSRRGAAFWAAHLLRTDTNESVELVELRGLVSQNVRDAFFEMEAIASGTLCQNYFYIASINTREEERLTPEQWALSVDTLEHQLGLDDQPRFVVQHFKEGRVHQHVVWSRIDADSMTTISDSLTYQKHECAARALEKMFGHEEVRSVLVKDRESLRPERRPKDYEGFRAADSKIDPKDVTRDVTALWRTADSGSAFVAALQEHGYILARGDRRDFCIIDPHGDDHSLARRVSGAKATEIRERLAEVDRDALPSVADARALAREQYKESNGDGGESPVSRADAEDAANTARGPVAMESADERLSAFDEVRARRLAEALGNDPIGDEESSSVTPSPAFKAVESARISEAIITQAARNENVASSGGNRFTRWYESAREHVASWRQQIQERASQYLSRWERDEMKERDAQYPSAPSRQPREGQEL